MSAMNFQTDNKSFRQLIGNGLIYQVPPFQRDYSWSEEQWKDLWADICEALEGNAVEHHYMGYLVLKSQDSKTFDIIDGQQRITTIVIIILAVLKNIQRLIDGQIDVENNKLRIDTLRNTYIGYLDPETLVVKTKLSLNRNNDDYFKNHLVELGHLPSRNIKPSERSLRKCFEFFDRHLLELFNSSSQKDGGAFFAAFANKISDHLFFTQITVSDELNAYKVFETLNARGVQLSSTDLLKNYLFSLLYDKSLQKNDKNLENRWNKIAERLGEEDFPDFLRYYWNSSNALVRKNELFKKIRNVITDKPKAMSLLRDIEINAEFYFKITDPENSQEDAAILKMFHVRQPIPLLLAVYRKLGESEFAKILHACVIISFRYNIICGLSPNDQESLYNRLAREVSEGKLQKSQDIIASMQLIYPSNNVFKEQFSEKIITARNKDLIKYILCEIECKISGKKPGNDNMSIEHILPQNPDDNWDNFSDNQIDEAVWRLGNLTLLSIKQNKNLSNLSYADKKDKYSESEYKLSQTITDKYEEWNLESIERRQKWLADQASSIWQLPQLS